VLGDGMQVAEQPISQAVRVVIVAAVVGLLKQDLIGQVPGSLDQQDVILRLRRINDPAERAAL